MSTELEIPTRLPIGALSISSINLFERCPEKWKRRYINREYEPPSGAMILGSAVGAAEAHADQAVIDGEARPTTEDVLDLFSDEWAQRTSSEEVAWDEKDPGEIKDTGIAAVQAYEADIVPTYTPLTVEREFYVQPEGVEWGFKGYLDLETASGVVADRKVRKMKMSDMEADSDSQATGYLLARRAEGNPATAFDFHVMVKTKKPYADIVTTSRTDVQLDRFVDRLYRVASEIHWRLERDVWSGAAPGAWWCAAKTCGFWASCSLGGAR